MGSLVCYCLFCFSDVTESSVGFCQEMDFCIFETKNKHLLHLSGDYLICKHLTLHILVYTSLSCFALIILAGLDFGLLLLLSKV